MSDKACVLCNHTTDDALQLGEKITFEDTTAHLYCLLLTSNLVQNGEDNEGIYGFMPKDIKSEVSRTKKLFCCFCHQKGATIGCCVKSCRHSFHLPCALQNDCRFEFTNTFRSFCELHHEIKQPKKVHHQSDPCTICFDEMGKYNPIRSIPLPCCNKNAWCHKLCLQKYAQTSGYFLKCPLCNDSNQFRDWIAQRGVFIPDRDAKWEVDEAGPNSFYGFEQHNERPSECIAKVCKCNKGRRFQVDKEHSKFSLVFCHYCGSHAVHLGCMNAKEFECDECAAALKRNQCSTESVATSSIQNSTVSGQSSTSSNIVVNSNSSTAVEIDSDIDERFGKYLPLEPVIISKYKLRECSIRLTRLTSSDFGFKCESNDIECDTVTDIKSSSDSQTEASSSDEHEIKPILRKSRKSNIFESDTDSEIGIRVRTGRMMKKNPFAIDSDSDQKTSNMDINENSKDMQSSNRNATPSTIEVKSPFKQHKQSSSGLRECQFSSSEEEPIRPSATNSLIRKFLFNDSSDDQMNGKENEKPTKSVAIVRPFSKADTSSDESVMGPLTIKFRSRNASIDGTSDDSHKSSITQRYDYLKKIVEKQHESVKAKVTAANDPSKTPEIRPDMTTVTPNKRKYRSVRSYFCDASSSDDELMEPKPKRKSPKKIKRSPANTERPSNQSTIKHFFKKQVNQAM